MKQLTTTNNINYFDKRSRYVTHQFKLEESLMERIFESCGYKFTIITLRNSEPHFIAKEVSEALGYKGTESLTTPIKRHDLSLLVLTKENGLTDLKLVSPISKSTRNLTIIPSSSLQEYLLKHATKPKAKEIGNILYEVLASGKTLVEVFEEEKNPVLDLLNTELESNEFGSKFNSWYKEKIGKCSYFWKWDKKNQLYNWQKSLIGLRMTLGSRFLKVAGKNSAKNVLKKQGASSKLTKSNRTIARTFDSASSDQMLFLPILTTKSTSIQFAESKDSSSSFYNFYTI